MREIERRLPAELHDASDHSARALGLINAAAIESFDNVEYIFKRQWLKEEQVAGVKVRADRLWVGVDHHAFEAHLVCGECGLAAAIIELNALTNAVGAAAEDDYFWGSGDARFIFSDALSIYKVRLFVGAVVVRGSGFELCGAGVNQFEDRLNAHGLAGSTDLQNGGWADGAKPHVCKLRIAVASFLCSKHQVTRAAVQRLCCDDSIFKCNQFGKLAEEPAIDLGDLIDAIDAPAHLECVANKVQAALAWDREFAQQRVFWNWPVGGRGFGWAEDLCL